MMGVNINCKEQDFCEEILSRLKVYESRNCRSLDPYVGKWVGIVKTGCGKATLVGYMLLGYCPVMVDSLETFRLLEVMHRVKPGSKFDFENKKYLYPIIDVRRCRPKEIKTRGIVTRRVPNMEED